MWQTSKAEACDPGVALLAGSVCGRVPNLLRLWILPVPLSPDILAFCAFRFPSTAADSCLPEIILILFHGVLHTPFIKDCPSDSGTAKGVHAICVSPSFSPSPYMSSSPFYDFKLLEADNFQI